MARHGGFAVAASVREHTVNEALVSAVGAAGPFYFPLPQTVDVAGVPVTLGGVAQVAAPAVELHPNPADAAIVHVAFFSSLRAQVGNGPTQSWKVRLDAAATVPFLLGVVDGNILLRIDPSTVTILPLAVTVLAGPPPPPQVIQALQSQAVAAAATAVVQQLPVVTLANLGSAGFSHTQSGRFKDASFSVFEWFTLTQTVGAIAVRVFEQAVTVAADFAGVTTGNPAELTDLTRAPSDGEMYVWTVTPETDPRSRPVVVGRQPKPAPFVVLVNIAVLRHLVNQMSTQVKGTPIRQDATLEGVRCEFSRFDKPLRGWEDGLRLIVTVQTRGVPVQVVADLQLMLQLYEGPSSEAQKRYPPAWRLLVAEVEIPLPFWAEAALLITRLLSVVIAAMVLPFIMVVNLRIAELVLKDVFGPITEGLNVADPQNIANGARAGLQGAVMDAGLPEGASFMTVTADGVHAGFGQAKEVPFALPAEPTIDVTVGPATWSVYDRRPIRPSVRLLGSATNLQRSALQAQWEVRRADTGAVVATGVRPYNGGVDNGIDVPHHSEALYEVAAYDVRCTLTMSLQSQAGVIWSGTTRITVDDHLDPTEWSIEKGGVVLGGRARRHPFVEWGPRPARYPSAWVRQQMAPRDPEVGFRNMSNEGIAAWVAAANAAGEDFFWTRVSRSRIHRTAVAARCSMLRRVADMRRSKEGAFRTLPLRFRDDLPFGWGNLALHRRELCDYCFFGGPDKQTPFPAFDWFEPPA